MVELPALFRPAMRPIFARLAFAILPAALPATAQDADFAAQAAALYRTRQQSPAAGPASCSRRSDNACWR